MRNNLLVIAFFSSLFAMSQDFKSVSATASVKSAIEKKHNETTSITANFSEKTHSEMFQNPQVGTGNFYFKKENKVRWDNSTAKQLILISGDKVKLYENGKINNNPTSQKVVKQIQGMMLSMLSGDFLNEKDFKIDYFENTKYNKLVLTPKNPRMAKYMQKIELLFNKKTNLLDEMTMIEGKQQSIVYTFTNQKINLQIADSKFTQQ